MRKSSFILLVNVLVCIHGWAADEFDTVKCGADVSKAMVGSHSSNERVVVLEARHCNLGLKDLRNGDFRSIVPEFLADLQW